MIAGMLHAAILGAAAAGQAGHLYVASLNSNAVFSYTLTNGIPAPAPAGTVGSVNLTAFGLGFGTDGSLYLADQQGVKVFSQASLSGPPVRFVPVAGSGPLTLDSSGDLFVANETAATYAYAPGAGGVAQPLATISSDGYLVTGLAAGPDGNLYLHAASLYVYADATTRPRLLRTACLANEHRGLAFDSEGRLYVGTGNGVERHPSTVHGCPAPRGVQFETGDYSVDVAVAGTYLYAAASPFPNADDYVDVFDISKPGSPPVATVTGSRSTFQQIAAITVGP